jgi:hypothetical protein
MYVCVRGARTQAHTRFEHFKWIGVCIDVSFKALSFLNNAYIYSNHIIIHENHVHVI